MFHHVAGPYRVSHYHGAGTPLCQAECLSNIVYLRSGFNSETGKYSVTEEVVAFSVILTQDCDLEQDHRIRFPNSNPESDKLIRSVLMAEVRTASDMLIRVAKNNKNEWKSLKIAQNTNPRFHFLQAISPKFDRLNEGLPELVIDFKHYFTVPTDELYRRISSGETRRRCVLVSPYLEHLAQRFASYLSRVGLPTDHESV